MDSLVDKTVKVILKLNKEEAQWLKGLVQNPLRCNPRDESAEEKEIRHSFCDALKNI